MSRARVLHVIPRARTQSHENIAVDLVGISSLLCRSQIQKDQQAIEIVETTMVVATEIGTRIKEAAR